MVAKKLSVKMFGWFSAKYGDEILTFGRQGDSKFGQLFQILMTRPGQKFSKRNIIEILYDWDKVENPNASLNNTIFRLRKYLDASPLPSGEYLFLDAGALWFGGEIETESDVWEFEKIAREFSELRNRQKKAELCEKACELYRGEFLPQLSNELWVIDKSQNYQKLYFEMMEYLFCYLKEEGDYGKLERFLGRAIKLYPYEGWEIWQIESLIDQGKYEEAEKLFQETSEYDQRKERFLSKEQKEHLYEVGKRIRQPEKTEKDIKQYLMKSMRRQGAYNCTLQGFLDCFRILKSGIKRETVRFCLLLCMVLDNNGRPVNKYESCKKQEEKLCTVFESHLRSGDIYTKYCNGQYLLLCVGADRENIQEIGTRIDMDYRKRCGSRGGISYRLLDDGGMW